MPDQPPSADELRLYQDLGWHRPNLAWAKLEILLGLISVSGGHLLSIYTIVHAGPTWFWLFLLGSLLLQSLGGYLALAGHRSHVYQSNNKLTAWLANRLAEINR